MKKFLIAKNIFFDLRIWLGWAQKLWAGYYPLNLEGFVFKSLLCLRYFCSSTVVLMVAMVVMMVLMMVRRCALSISNDNDDDDDNDGDE